jgi:hypothetical protein
MKFRTDLYKLIKSLTKSEKRYFKIYAASHTKKESNNYLLLFDAIDRQEIYNEEKLKRKFRSHTFGKNLAKTKYLLCELIIKMQLQLRKGKHPDSKIRLLLDAVEFHYSKSLYDLASAALQKAKKLARFFEHYSYWIEALDWEKKLFTYSNNKSDDYTLKSINKEYKIVKDLLNHEMKLAILLQEVQLLTEPASDNSLNGLIIELEILFKNRLITKYKAKTFLSKLYTQEIFVLQAQVVKNYRLVFLNLNKIYNLWEDHTEKAAIFPYDFIRFCTTYMSCCTSARRKGIYYDELQGRLLGLTKISSVDGDKIFFLVSMYDFIFNLVNDNHEVCAIQLFTIKDLIDKHIEKLSSEDTINLYYHISAYYFIKGEFRETLKWTDKIQKLVTKKGFPNLQGYCCLLSLISKYELQVFDGLESELQKTHQFFSTEKIIQPFEKLVLSYLGRVKKGRNSTHELSKLIQLFNSLQHINNGNPAYKMTADKAISQWVQSKSLKKNTPLFN